MKYRKDELDLETEQASPITNRLRAGLDWRDPREVQVGTTEIHDMMRMNERIAELESIVKGQREIQMQDHHVHNLLFQRLDALETEVTGATKVLTKTIVPRIADLESTVKLLDDNVEQNRARIDNVNDVLGTTVDRVDVLFKYLRDQQTRKLSESLNVGAPPSEMTQGEIINKLSEALGRIARNEDEDDGAIGPRNIARTALDWEGYGDE